MKKMAVLILLAATAVSVAEPLPPIQATRIIIDLIKDEDVTTASAYESPPLDYVAAPIAIKYVDAFLEVYGNIDSTAIAGMTNAQKSRAYLRTLRRLHRYAYVRISSRNAGLTAEDNARVSARVEADTDIGQDQEPGGQ